MLYVPDPEPLPTLAEAKTALKAIAGTYGFTGSLRDLCPLLNSFVPLEQWTVQTFVDASRCRVEHWKMAIASLAPPASVEVPDKPTEPDPVTDDGQGDISDDDAPNEEPPALTLTSTARPIVYPDGNTSGTVAAMTR